MTENIVPPLLSAEKQTDLLMAPERVALTVRIIPQVKRLGNAILCKGGFI